MKAIYIRTSTQEQNPENQLAACQQLAGDGAQVFEDRQSAWKDSKRESFELLYRQITAGKVSDLYIWDLDRLYRNRKSLIAFFQLCKQVKCHIHSVRQDWLEKLNAIPAPWNEMMYDLMLQIMGWLAEEESNKRSERVKASIRLKDGLTMSYKGNRWGRKAISENKQQIIRAMRIRGATIRKIAKEVNLSPSVVHKYCQEIAISENAENGVF